MSGYQRADHRSRCSRRAGERGMLVAWPDAAEPIGAAAGKARFRYSS